MNKPSQEDLLGYLLGAMDAPEQRDIQQQLDDHPQLEDELLQIKNALLPLDYLDGGGPRPGLARRTCEKIAFASREMSDESFGDVTIGHTAEEPATSSWKSQQLAENTPVCMQPSLTERVFVPSNWSLPDVLVGVACLSIMAGVLFPAIAYTRHNSRLAACQGNLQELGRAFLKYSESHDGYFVAIPPGGKLAVSGCFGPLLKEAGLLETDELLACQGIAQSRTPVHIPSAGQIESAVGEQLAFYRRTMGGHYGYSMGYQQDGRYSPPRNDGRTNVVLLADAPSSDQPGRRSANHGSSGQNCLFEDGHVQFVSGHSVGDDAIFENDYGIVGPGSDAHDSVIAASHLSPGVAESIEFVSP